MTKNHILKGVVWGILCLLCSTSVISNIDGRLSASEKPGADILHPHQIFNESSVICGYVINDATGLVVANVDVDLDWEDFQGNSGWDTTFTNSAGFYLFNTVPVDFYLHFYSEDFFHEGTSRLTVYQNQVFWYNISLVPVPDQTVRIQGFITDNSSTAPINDASINLHWADDEGHYWSNYTFTNSSGYYSLWSIPGRTHIYVQCENYFSFYSDYFFTQNNSLIWFNISLVPYPAVSVVVCGYITDADIGDPIPDAYISLYCSTEYGSFYNTTYTNGIGFYSLGTIPGNVSIYSHRSGYSSSSSSTYLVNENDTLWVNLSLSFRPIEDSKVKGYVTDSETHAAVRNAFIRYDWKDDVGHFYSKYTFTDQKGFYSITAPAGSVQFFFTGNGYTNQQTSWFFINEYSDSWVNATLEPEITLMFEKPQSHIYINNNARFPLLSRFLSRISPGSLPLIIGPLEIIVNITKTSIMGCSRVDFYIDEVYLWTDSQEPFTYMWNTKSSSRHIIQAIAYDNAGPCRIESIMVRKIV